MDSDANDVIKVVARGLPFEATKEEVLKYFGIEDDQLTLPTWSDSGRCKGIAFIECKDEKEKALIMEKDQKDFTCGENSRNLSIKDFEQREQKRGKRSRRGGRGGGKNNRGRREGGDRSSGQTYDKNSETDREVYVSNVSFEATEDDIKKFFDDCGEIEDVTIPTLYTTGRPKGFVFVRFTETEGREKALNKNGETLINRVVGVRENKGRASRPQPKPREPKQTLSQKPQGCTTIFVGNLPWSTDELALADQFKDCGKVKSTRVVRQSWTKRSRGFGYVEFEDEASVDTAVQKPITIDGRELRLDYAENLSSNAAD